MELVFFRNFTSFLRNYNLLMREVLGLEGAANDAATGALWAPVLFTLDITPSDPKEIWIEWGLVFAAQVLKPSLRASGELNAPTDETLRESGYNRYIPSKDNVSALAAGDSSGEPFLVHLQNAMKNGRGLPFDAPQEFVSFAICIVAAAFIRL